MGLADMAAGKVVAERMSRSSPRYCRRHALEVVAANRMEEGPLVDSLAGKSAASCRARGTGFSHTYFCDMGDLC